jgi:hypothetical protein
MPNPLALASTPLPFISSNPALPMLVVPRRVQNRCHIYNLLRFIDLIYHAIGKTIRITPPDVFGWMTAAIQQGVFRQSLPYSDNFFHKLRA